MTLPRTVAGGTLGEMKRIRYRDLDLPEGRCVADGKGIRPWDENTAAELALTGMLLSQGAKRAQAMLDTAEGREARGGAQVAPGSSVRVVAQSWLASARHRR